MKAVNLIPANERRDGRLSLSQLSPITLGVLGGLLVALLVVTALVLIGNTTNDRRDEAARIQAKAAAVQRQVDVLTPNMSALQARERSVAAARALAATRYDWSRLLGSVSRRLPKNVTLTDFNGAVGSAAGATSPPTAAAGAGGSTPGGTVALSGCAASLSAIAGLMERMRSIDGVQDVTFSTSSRGASAGSSDCRHPRSFELNIALDGPSAVSSGGTS